jgi:hypothetical protein
MNKVDSRLKVEEVDFVPNMDEITEVTIEEIIELIRSGETTEILYKENPNPTPNVITIVCGNKFCTDVREVKSTLTTHGREEVYIRSHDKDDIITSWKEYYVLATRINISFKVTGV